MPNPASTRQQPSFENRLCSAEIGPCVATLTDMGLFLLIFSLASLLRGQPAAREIVRRSIETNNADFQALPKYSHHETDVTTKAGAARGSKTYKVMMLEGSPYNQLIAINNEPLPPPERAREEKKR